MTLLLIAAALAADTAQMTPDQGAGAYDDGHALVQATLLFDRDRVQPSGTFSAGVLLTVQAGWHVYWLNPGDSGLPTEVAWSSDQATLGSTQYPAPQVFTSNDGSTSFGYEDEVLLVAEARVLSTSAHEVVVRAEVTFFACREKCVMGQVDLVSTLPVVVGNELLFRRFEARVPRSAEQLGVRVSSERRSTGDQSFVVVVRVAACEGPGCPKDVVLRGEHRPLALNSPASVQWTRPFAAPESDAQFALSGRFLNGLEPAPSFDTVVELSVDGRDAWMATTLNLAASGPKEVP